MTATFKRIIIAAIVLIVLAVGLSLFVITGGCASSASSTGNPVEDARNNTLNTIIDATGIKDRIEQELYSKVNDISEATGIPVGVLNSAVESLDIHDWQVTSLPETAVEENTIPIETDEFTGTVTTYETPDVVTVNAYGQTVTLKVPDSAQTYVSLLGYLG